MTEIGGLPLAWAAICALVALGLGLFIRLYCSPGHVVGAAAPASSPLRGSALVGILVAGSIWGLYNAALAMIFGFGPAMLVERGWSASAASSTSSVALWMVAVTVPLGGLLADRPGRRNTVLAGGLASFALLMLLAPAL